MLIKAGKNGQMISFAKDILTYIIGGLIYAVSVDMFTAPNDIAPGGVTGIATIVHSFSGLPIGGLILVINIPLFIAGGLIIGRKYILKTIMCTVTFTIAIDALAPILPRYIGNPLLAAVFGGIAAGAALGIIFSRGSSTGGADVIARIAGKYYPHITQGRLLLIIDIIVVAVAAVFFGMESALYALIAIFIGSKVVDTVLYGKDNGKLMLIVTNESASVARSIAESTDRGATVLHGRGAYSGGERDVLMCAVRRNEAYKVRGAVRRADRSAFIIVSDATEILGEGFRPISQDEFGEQTTI